MKTHKVNFFFSQSCFCLNKIGVLEKDPFCDFGCQASAKRFRVTGSGRIMRRRSGKQHLLVKKNTKRKLRLSKMVGFLKNPSFLI